MTQIGKSTFFSFLFTLALFPSVISAQEIDRAADPPPEPAFYLFHASQLSPDSDQVTVRFQYVADDRIIGADQRILDWRDAESRLVRLPDSVWSRWLLSGEHAMRLQVFAGDTLLADLDREQLVAYNRVLAYTRAAERDLRSIPNKIQCNSPCGGGCGPYDDYDCDGHNNISDNCTDDHNPNQADCDGDGIGDVCDVTNGTFQASGAVETCMTDRDEHPLEKTFEHHVEQRYVDTSSCNAPDYWTRWVRADRDCDYSVSDHNCCNGLQPSLNAVGDTTTYWCASGVRNVDFCN